MPHITLHRAKKKLGQNFLIDERVIWQLVQAINPQPTDWVVEIGPGQAALTIPLLHLVNELHAIEVDRDLIPLITKKCASFANLRLHHADALKVDFAQFQCGQRLIRVVGNLPYNISTPFLFHLLQQRSLIQDMHFMLQKEVVQRMAAIPKTKAYGRLSVMLQAFFQVEPLFNISPDAFRPKPSVDSSIVRLTPLLNQPRVDEAILSKVVAACFAQRRKTLKNNLKSLVDAAWLESIGIDPRQRAEDLSVMDFLRMAQAFHNESTF